MRFWVFALTAFVAVAIQPGSAQQNPYLGAWNITGVAPDTNYIYWLEVKDEGGKLTGMFLNRGGHALPLAAVKIENGELMFQGATNGQPAGPVYRAKVENGKLVGQHTLVTAARAATADQPARPASERVVKWVGVRPPTWPASNANGKHEYGKAVALFDGKSLDAFGGQNPSAPLGWTIDDTLMTNPKPPANNLVSKEKFKDFKLEAEYKLAEHSNSGIYVRGRYELQILDDLKDTTTEPFLTQMAIYGRTAPKVKASRAAGEWQTVEAIVVGNKITLTFNGQKIHDNQPLLGITGGALDADELAPGPLMIQGDHGQVWFRKVVVTPITKAGT